MDFPATYTPSGLDGTNGFVFNGPIVSQAGYSVAVGDVNGDGISDLILGAPAASPGGRAVAGAIWIVPGASSYLAAYNPNTPAVRMLGGFTPGDNWGYAVSVADLNGDGFDDVVASSPFWRPLGRGNAGGAVVTFGQASFPQFQDFALGNPAFSVLDGPEAGDNELLTLIRDFKRDLDAYLTTASARWPGEAALQTIFATSDGGPNEAGRLYTLKNWTGSTIDLASVVAPYRVNGAQPDDYLGFGAGGLDDVDGDGVRDLIYSIAGYDAPGRTNAGLHIVEYGKLGLLYAVDVTAPASATANKTFITGPANAGLGFIAALGDIDGDGAGDLAVSYPTYNSGRGEVFILQSGLGFRGKLIDLANAIPAGKGFRLEGQASNDAFGASVTGIGDFNGDGYGDFIVGAPGASAGLGAGYIFYGKAGSVWSDGTPLTALNGSNGFKIASPVASSGFGRTLSWGDFNADGISDLVFGAPAANNGAGAVYVVFGLNGGAATTGANTFTGGGARDVWNGLAGDDTVNTSAGDDLYDGGPGVDLWKSPDASSNFNWWQADNGEWCVQDLRAQGAPQGTDQLFDFERLQFSDKTVKLSGLTVSEALTTAFQNILRTSGAGAADQTFLNGLIASVTGATKTAAQAVTEIVAKADQTTAVAAMSYQFFLGFVPSKGGFDYLVSPQGPNPNNINSAYYQAFNIENRYINFAVNLGKAGEGAAGFLASYGAKTLFEATKSAYATVFGLAPSDAKVHAILDPTFVINGQPVSRAQYFAIYGGDGANGIGTKAAMVGWLLTEAAKADLGMYAQASNAFLTDLADGAQMLVDVVGTYGNPEWAFGG